MPFRDLVTMAALGASLWAGESVGAVQQHLGVCIDGDITVTAYVRHLVSRIFAPIDLRIDWRDPRDCPANAIRITVNAFTPPRLLPRTLAYALPYEGTHIVVFYDRVQAAVEKLRVPTLTAHVIAHEIGHILEGINRHSATGVMKARWEKEDYSQMAWKPLPFAAEDVILIHRGLETRSASLAPAR